MQKLLAEPYKRKKLSSTDCAAPAGLRTIEEKIDAGRVPRASAFARRLRRLRRDGPALV